MAGHALVDEEHHARTVWGRDGIRSWEMSISERGVSSYFCGGFDGRVMEFYFILFFGFCFITIFFVW